MESCGYGVTVARLTTSKEEWFNSTHPLKIHRDFPAKHAMAFRKRYVKGFIIPGACSYYIAVSLNNKVFGILGFTDYSGWSNTPVSGADIGLRADTTPSEYKGSTELLLYVIRTQEVKRALEQRFCREINTIYSKAFSLHPDISKYRKHGELVAKNIQKSGEKIMGYDIGYIFQAGSIVSLKEAKSRFILKHYGKTKD